MPYIEGTVRYQLENWIEDGNWPNPSNVGELNYVLSCVCDEYIRSIGKKYQTFNDVIGALEACKLELYRRLVAPYEDVKLKENGDVY